MIEPPVYVTGVPVPEDVIAVARRAQEMPGWSRNHSTLIEGVLEAGRWPLQNAAQWAFGRRAGIDWRQLWADIEKGEPPSS
jgi:hypothetical protein